MGPDAAGLPQLQNLIVHIIEISVGAAFILLVIMLVVGGLKYLTSGGDAKALTSAGQTLTWAILGVVFLVLIWLILLLTEAFTGLKFTTICLKFSGC